MSSIGRLIDGQYVKMAGNFDVMDVPTATESTNGLLSPTDKKIIDNAYTVDDIASKEQINNLFKKGE